MKNIAKALRNRSAKKKSQEMADEIERERNPKERWSTNNKGKSISTQSSRNKREGEKTFAEIRKAKE